MSNPVNLQNPMPTAAPQANNPNQTDEIAKKVVLTAATAFAATALFFFASSIIAPEASPFHLWLD